MMKNKDIYILLTINIYLGVLLWSLNKLMTTNRINYNNNESFL